MTSTSGSAAAPTPASAAPETDPTIDPITDSTLGSTPVQKVLAEALGTFVWVFFGCGVAVVSDGNLVGTAAAFGLALLVMSYALGRVSGAHFNPAVTLAAGLGGRIGWRQVPLYLLGQVVGALVGGGALHLVLAGTRYESSTLAATDYGNGTITWGSALALEAVMTLILVLVVLGVSDPRNRSFALVGPLVVGLALSLVTLLGLPLTGASVNPARSLGVAVFAGGTPLEHLWLFVVAPLLGAVVAGIGYPVIFGRSAAGRETEEPVVGPEAAADGPVAQPGAVAPSPVAPTRKATVPQPPVVAPPVVAPPVVAPPAVAPSAATPPAVTSPAPAPAAPAAVAPTEPVEPEAPSTPRPGRRARRDDAPATMEMPLVDPESLSPTSQPGRRSRGWGDSPDET